MVIHKNFSNNICYEYEFMKTKISRKMGEILKKTRKALLFPLQLPADNKIRDQGHDCQISSQLSFQNDNTTLDVNNKIFAQTGIWIQVCSFMCYPVYQKANYKNRSESIFSPWVNRGIGQVRSSYLYSRTMLRGCWNILNEPEFESGSRK